MASARNNGVHVQPSAASHRLVTLDALRCLAVLLVLGRHFDRPDFGVPAPVGLALRAWQSFGWIGVDLFFVLSGFLVSGLLFVEHQRHGDVQALRFLGRRGCKIYPGFYALLLVSLLWLGSRLPGVAFVWEALFVQNYLEPTVWNHTWSLAVEEHFYLALALAIGLATRRQPGPASLRGLPLWVGFVCLTVLAMRIATWLRQPTGHLLFQTHLRLDALTFGVGIAYAWHMHRERTVAWIGRWRGVLLAAGLLLLLPCLLLPIENSAVVNTVGLTTNYLGFGALLLVCLTSERLPQWGVVRGLAAVGFYSYSMYLWHMPVQKATRWFVEPIVGHPLSLVVYVLGSVLLGIVMAKLIELPFLALRDRWLPSRSKLARANVAQVVAASTPSPAHASAPHDLDAIPPALASRAPVDHEPSAR